MRSSWKVAIILLGLAIAPVGACGGQAAPRSAAEPTASSACGNHFGHVTYHQVANGGAPPIELLPAVGRIWTFTDYALVEGACAGMVIDAVRENYRLRDNRWARSDASGSIDLTDAISMGPSELDRIEPMPANLRDRYGELIDTTFVSATRAGAELQMRYIGVWHREGFSTLASFTIVEGQIVQDFVVLMSIQGNVTGVSKFPHLHDNGVFIYVTEHVDDNTVRVLYIDWNGV